MTPGATLKVLVADDHAPMRQILHALLASVAGEIIEAGDGAAAVRLFAESRPDWAILDIQMKPVGGLAAAREIRRRFPTARIVIVTQYDDADLREEAARAGACAYVLKDDLRQLPAILAGGPAQGAGDSAGASPAACQKKGLDVCQHLY
jgi:DNA-binding NarL/FixJ family response regulator